MVLRGRGKKRVMMRQRKERNDRSAQRYEREANRSSVQSFARGNCASTWVQVNVPHYKMQTVGERNAARVRHLLPRQWTLHLLLLERLSTSTPRLSMWCVASSTFFNSAFISGRTLQLHGTTRSNSKKRTMQVGSKH